MFADRVDGRLEKIARRDTGDFHGILKAKKNPLASALLGRHFENVFALECDGPLSDLVKFAPSENLAERRLARTVPSHDGVDFARLDDQVDAFKNIPAARSGD